MNPISKPQLKILHVSSDYDFYLGQRIFYGEEAQKQGYKCIFATPAPDKLKPEEHNGIEFIPLSMSRKGRRPITELISFFHFLRLYRLVKPDIVHHFTIKPVVYGSLAAKILGVPYVVNTITGLGSIYIQKNLINYITQFIIGLTYKLTLNSPNVKVIFQNPDDQELFLTRGYVSSEHCQVILGSGVNIDRFQPTELPNKTPVILYPGRLLWDKGLGDLIEAGKILKKRGYNFEIQACGPVDTMNPSGIPEEVILKWQNNYDWFKWLGVRSDMPEIFAQSHIACLPSYREGVPIALLEATASGRPVITTEAPGCKEVVEQTLNGYKVPINNPTSLAMRLAKLLDNPQLQNKMGQEGRKIAVSKFSRVHVIEEVMKIYDEAAKQIVIKAETISS